MIRPSSISATGFDWLRCLAISLLALSGTSYCSSLEDILQRAAKTSERLVDQVAAVTCVEAVQQQKFDIRNRLLSRHDGQFSYVLLLQVTPDRLLMDETREFRGKQGKRPSQPLLDSAGFSVLSLVFHPQLQSSYRFRELPPALGETVHAIAFEQVKGQRTPSVLETPTGPVPVEWHGEAWIDPSTGAIGRIRAEWSGPGEGHALRQLTADVRYAPITFQNPGESYWLPKSAEVEVRTVRSRWHNRHEYSDYNRFSVSTTIRMSEVK